MKYRVLICIILFLLQSCVKSNRDCNIEENISTNEVTVNHVDSISISISEENDLDYLILNIHNPTNDIINLSPIYHICKTNGIDSCLLTGDIVNIPSVLKPDAKTVFRISLGTDSIEYNKKNEYIITVGGRSGDKEIIFYKKCHLGNRYKLNGKTILEPDTVILPISYIDLGINQME